MRLPLGLKERAKPNVTKGDRTTTLTKISLVLESLRLEMALDIVFSGIELELYGIDELPFVYWYTERIINRYLEITVRLASSRSSSSRFQSKIPHLILRLPSLLRMATALPGCAGFTLPCYAYGK